jgi:hypothetical protein
MVYITGTPECDNTGNLPAGILLHHVAMVTFARNKLRILILAVYIPLSLSVGMLHSDDLRGSGNGHLVVQKQSAQSLARSLDSGFCYACLFTAGHIVNHEPFVPILSAGRAVGSAGILITPESSPQPHPARAPPVFTLL